MEKGIDLKYIRDLIINEKNFVPNRSGSTPLFTLSEELAETKVSDENKKDIEAHVSELYKYFEEFDVLDVRNLVYFIDASGFGNSLAIAKKYSKYFNNLGNGSDKNLEKRGLILRWIAHNSNYPLPADVINAETVIKSKFPWLWIEAMANRNWKSAVHEITQILKADNSCYEKLRSLFSIWIDNIKGKEKLFSAFSEWLPYIEPEDKKDLVRWANNRDIPIELKPVSDVKGIHGKHDEDKKIDENAQKFLAKVQIECIDS